MNPSKPLLLCVLLFAAAARAQNVPEGRLIDRQYYWDEDATHVHQGFISKLIDTGNFNSLRLSLNEKEDPDWVCAIAPGADWALNRKSPRQTDQLDYLRLLDLVAYSVPAAPDVKVRSECGVANYHRTSPEILNGIFIHKCAQKPSGSKEHEVAAKGEVAWQYVSRDHDDYLPGRVVEDSLLRILKNDDKEVSVAVLKTLRHYVFRPQAQNEFIEALVKKLDAATDATVKAEGIKTLMILSPTMGTFRRSLVLMAAVSEPMLVRGEAMDAFAYGIAMYGMTKGPAARTELTEVEVEPQPGVYKTYSPYCLMSGFFANGSPELIKASQCAAQSALVGSLFPKSYLQVPGATLDSAKAAYCKDLSKKK